jgi:hypothetical protein
MLPLEVVGPGGSLSTALIAAPMDETAVEEGPGRRLRRRKAEEPGTAAMAARRIVATSAVQLRPDDCGARPSAGERLAAEAAERTGFVGDRL